MSKSQFTEADLIPNPMTRPHHPTPEAIELTGGEKTKIMNDFLLNPNLPQSWIEERYLSLKTVDQLQVYKIALSVAYERCKAVDPQICSALKELSDMVDQAGKDSLFEGQQLPWKD